MASDARTDGAASADPRVLRDVTLYEWPDGWLTTAGRDKPAAEDAVSVPAVVGVTVAEIEKLRERTHEIREQESQERAALQSQVDRFRNAFAQAEKAVREFRADWTTDPPSQEPGGFWRYTSHVTRDAMALVVQQRDEARAEAKRECKHKERAYALADEARAEAARFRATLERITAAHVAGASAGELADRARGVLRGGGGHE